MAAAATGPDEESLVSVLEHNLSAAHLTAGFALLEKMGAHHPAEAHWYLTLIGIDPARQGRGLGSALLSRGLERCDTDGLTAYLESSNPRNVPLYQRHGFRITGEIQVDNSPTMFAMVRLPQRA